MGSSPAARPSQARWLPADSRSLTLPLTRFPAQHGTERATAACEASLSLLGDPIDLMMVHWPGVAKQDASSPRNAELRRETWRVLERFHRQGRLRAIGVSNYEQRHLEELLRYAEVPPGARRGSGPGCR